MAYSWPGVWYVSQGDGSTTGYYAVGKWTASHAYSAGALVRQNATPSVGNERVFACVVAGTSLSSEPSWTVTHGAKTTESGGPAWVEVTGNPAVNGDTTNAAVWVASSTPSVGTLIYDSTSGTLQICTTSGAGGSSKPSFASTAGSTTTDSSATWTCLGAVSGFGAWAAPICWLETAISWTGATASTYFCADNGTAVSSAARTVSPGLGSYVLSVDHAVSVPPSGSSALKAGHVIESSNGNIPSLVMASSAQRWYGYGLTLGTTNFGGFTIGGNSVGNVEIYLEDCTLYSSSVHVGATFSGPGRFVLTNCQTNLAGVGLEFRNSTVVWKGSNGGAFFLNSSGAVVALGGGGASNSTVLFEGCDFSAGSSSFVNMDPSYGGGTLTLKDCKLPSTWPNASVAIADLIVDALRCDNGGTNYRNERHTLYGDMTTQHAYYRSGGASDGTTPVSWQIVTTVNSGWWDSFEAWPIAIWNPVTGTNRTVTVYGCAFVGTIPNNDDAWLAVEYLGASGSPLGSFANSSKSNILASNAALTSDTSTWVAAARISNHAYTLGQIMQPTGDPNRVYMCTTAGTSNTTEPSAYASASDGQVIEDGAGAGAAYFTACNRFKLTATLSSPQPAQVGYLYATPRIAKYSTTFLIDPLINLS